MSGTPAHNNGAAVTLSRNMGLFSVTMIGIGGMIGAGIFALTGIAAGVAGPAMILVFMLNGLLTLLTALAYAELSSAFPRAGGGYIWVREALGGLGGFMSGWMGWFAYVTAGALYAITFGHFAAELWQSALGSGISTHWLALGFMSLVVALFTALNFRGTSEAVSTGNVITIAKLLILALLVLFGLAAMIGTPNISLRFLSNMLPHGVTGVLAAMGLTFIAFEGYEIIAQSGEEVINPGRNIPKAIFLSIGITVVVYVLVAIISIGAVHPPAGMTPSAYLGSEKVLAIVEVAQQVFPWGIGGMVLLISGLVATMSALNATTYSASRVSFAMARNDQLPEGLARVHPVLHTPTWAVIISGSLMLLAGWLLPLAQAASAASILFLLMFVQVNLALLRLRRTNSGAKRPFRSPYQPYLAVIAIFFNLAIAIYQIIYSPAAGIMAILWIGVGGLVYAFYSSKVEAREQPKEVLHEEVFVSRAYSVLVPARTPQEAQVLGPVGAALAQARGGELLALHVVRIPRQLDLKEGLRFARYGRQVLEQEIEAAGELEVPVHVIIRVGRAVSEAIRKTAIENASDLLVLGWPGFTRSRHSAFGSVIDVLIANPPADLAVVRMREPTVLRRILVPVAGGPNSRLALRVAVDLAKSQPDRPARVVLLKILPVGSGQHGKIRASKTLNRIREGSDFPYIELKTVEDSNVVNAVLSRARQYDLVVLGATAESLFRNFLMGNVTEQIARRSPVGVVVVKRRSSPLRSLLRDTVLEPEDAPEQPNKEEPKEAETTVSH